MEEIWGRGTRQRRALNMVWTAAGEYGFLPDFLAFHRDGSPDLYLNSVVGFAHGAYDQQLLHAYVCRLDESLLREMFSDILWLGIEHAVYERELPQRPVLADLRREHARRFLLDQEDLPMQQLMMRSELIHTLKTGRCREVLTGRSGIRNPWDKALYEALKYPGCLTTEEIIGHTEDVLSRFFVFRFADLRHRRVWHISLGSRLNAWLRRLLPVEQRRGSGMRRCQATRQMECDGALPAETFRGWDGSADAQRALAEVRRAFGRPLFSEMKRCQIERELCVGAHRRAQLYFARGGKNEAGSRAENRAFFAANRIRYRLAIRQLRRRVQSSLSVFYQPVELRGKTGCFRPGLVWQALKLNDNRVFALRRECSRASFDVMLLLDASESRAGQQALIASQAYAIASALRLCHIPVQVVSFCSTRGVTVFCQLKALDEESCEGIFDYSAQGWNRDGLALAGAERMLRQEEGRSSLLLVLTDARPGDELGLAADGLRPGRRYMDEAAVQDAAAAARALRRHGVKLVGLINSVLPEAVTGPAVREIYGKDSARIEEISRLSQTVGTWIVRQIGQDAG